MIKYIVSLLLLLSIDGVCQDTIKLEVVGVSEEDRSRMDRMKSLNIPKDEYDEKGNLINDYQDAFTFEIYGLWCINRIYDSKNRLVEQRYLNKTGELVNVNGSSIVKYSYNDRDSLIETSYFNQNGIAMSHSIHNKHDHPGGNASNEIDEYISRIDSDYTLDAELFYSEHPVYDSINDNGAVTVNFDSNKHLIRVKRKSIDDKKGKSYTAFYYYRNGSLIYFISEVYNVTKKSFVQYVIGDQSSGTRMYFNNGVLVESFNYENGSWVKQNINDSQVITKASAENRLSEYFKKVLKSS